MITYKLHRYGGGSVMPADPQQDIHRPIGVAPTVSHLADHLTQLGADGFRLVATLPDVGSDDQVLLLFVAERPD